MLVSIEDVMQLDEYAGANPDDVKRKINAIESAIRAYTNNNFIVRGARITAPAVDGAVQGTSPYIKAGDRVYLARSARIEDENGHEVAYPVDANHGLYDVVSVDGGITTLDEQLYDSDVNDVFAVHYPEAIKAGVIDLLKWDAMGRDKVGISSETISRHSVSYYQFNDSEMVMGYPAALMGFLKPFVKARF